MTTTQKKLLLEKLQKIYDRAQAHNVPRSFFVTLHKFMDVYDQNQALEPIEKRQLLKFTLQNLQLEGSLACYNEVKPFDAIRKYAMRQAWLRD